MSVICVIVLTLSLSQTQSDLSRNAHTEFSLSRYAHNLYCPLLLKPFRPAFPRDYQPQQPLQCPPAASDGSMARGLLGFVGSFRLSEAWRGALDASRPDGGPRESGGHRVCYLVGQVLLAAQGGGGDVKEQHKARRGPVAAGRLAGTLRGLRGASKEAEEMWGAGGKAVEAGRAGSPGDPYGLRGLGCGERWDGCWGDTAQPPFSPRL